MNSTIDKIRTALLASVPGTGPAVELADTEPTDGVDNEGAGVSPVAPPLEPSKLAPAPPALPPVPAVGVEARTLPGARASIKPSLPPARRASMTNYTLTNNQPIRVVPGMGPGERRRVTIVVVTDPQTGRVHLQTDARNDTTGFPLPVAAAGCPILYSSGDDLYLNWPFQAVPGTSPVISVMIEPLACDCG